MTTIEKFPPGNYLCNLLIHGKEQKLNFEIQGEELVCVDATERGMIGLRGKFELLGGNGVFLVQLRGGDFLAAKKLIGAGAASGPLSLKRRTIDVEPPGGTVSA